MTYTGTYKYTQTHTCVYTCMCKTKIKDYLQCIDIAIMATIELDDKSQIRSGNRSICSYISDF